MIELLSEVFQSMALIWGMLAIICISVVMVLKTIQELGGE